MAELDSWAAQVEAEGHGPQRQEWFKDGIKHVIEYRTNDKGQRVKITAQYKVERKKVPKAIAARRKWRKYGDAKDDGSSSNPANTLLSEEVEMKFTRNQAGELLEIRNAEEDPLAKMKAGAMTKMCKFCSAHDHFSFQCPYKHLMDDSELEGPGADPAAPTQAAEEVKRKEKAGVYVTPHMKANAAGKTLAGSDRRDDYTVRITNLPEETTEEDLKEILGAVTGGQGGGGGRSSIYRTFLARDKVNNRCKGFAFVTFHNREDAEKAILILAKHKYEHLILKVEWARPNNNQ